MGAGDPRKIQVFVASPADVQTERERVERTVVRLNREFAGSANFQVYRWEHGFYSAHAQPQDLILRPAECDVVIVLFGHRLGSPMPDSFSQRMADGSAYPSGTAYELLSAIEASAARGGRPAVYVFRSSAERVFREDQDSEWETAKIERKRLDAFFDQWFNGPANQTLRLYHRFRDPDHLAEQVDELLRQWAGLSLRTAPQWQIDRDGSPFRGLEQFDARHSRVFFGRDRKVERAMRELTTARARERGLPFLLVVGPSGSGKSSLVRAGLVPRLTQGNLVSEVDGWRIAVMKPGGSATPFLALAQSLFASGDRDADPGGFGPALPELAAGPFRSVDALAELMQAAPASATAPLLAALEEAGQAEQRAGGFSRDVRVDLLLVVDQLEEIFGDVSDEQRKQFASLLTELARSSRCWIVATLRADLYPRMLDHSSPFLALKDSGGLYDLASPGQAELAEILQKSADAAGLSYGSDPRTGKRLDERLLEDAEGADTLPLLQFCLKQLYEKRIESDGRVELTYEAYQEMGGLDGAISNEAEQTIAQLGRPTREVDQVLGQLLRQMAVRVAVDPAAVTSGPGLTLRAMPLASATPDASSRMIVDDLVRARLMIVHTEGEQPPSIRLAHERVLSSWERARRIVETYRDYFRVRADLEQQYGRWETGGRRSEFLLAKGTALQDAERVVREFGPEIPGKMREFVASSGRRARLARNLRVAAVVALALFALLATSAEQKAARNYQAAKGAADQLVATIALDLRGQATISSSAIDSAFGAADALIEGIRTSVAAKGSFPARQFQDAFARIQSVFGLGSGSAAQLSELDRSRSNLLYEFAETYHQTKNSLPKAILMADQSLAIRHGLRAAGDRTPQTLASIAEAEMLVADLERTRVEQARTPEYGKVRQHLQSAWDALQQLPAGMLEESRFAQDASGLQTRLGDVDTKDGKGAAALADYRRAQRFALTMFRQAPGSPETATELAWTYRKFGQSSLANKDYGEAVRSLEDEVCLRRRIVSLQPGKWKAEQDLGWALEWNAAARMGSQTADDGPTRLVAVEALYRRMTLAVANSTQKGLYEDLRRSLRQLAAVSTAANETAAAEQFGQAASALQDGIAQAFPDRQAEQHVVPALQQQNEILMRQRGPGAMLGAGRFLVEWTVAQFSSDDKSRVEEAAQGCWGAILQTTTAAR